MNNLAAGAKRFLLGARHGATAERTLSRADYGFVVAVLSILWLAALPLLAQRINTWGACATNSCASALAVETAKYHNFPATLRLSDSYEVWSRNLSGMDMADYLEAGCVFAQGKGLFIKMSTGLGTTYVPFCYHPPLTPFLIGIVIKLLGEKSVFPYFLLICAFQYISALSTVVLAGYFVKTRLALMLAGLLSLFCWPVLEYTYGVGLFSSEAVIFPFFALSLLSLAAYRKKASEELVSTIQETGKSIASQTRRLVPYAFFGSLFGACITVAAYARDQFGGFATFSALLLVLKGLFKRRLFFKALTFAVVAILLLHALEGPWEKRNQKYLGQRVMSIISWNYYVLWGWCIWPEPEVVATSDADCCVGVGTFVAPKLQPVVAAALKKDMKSGAMFALKSYLETVIQHPIEVIAYRAKFYDCLWFGHRKEVFIYLWCVVSAAFFGAFVFFNRGRFYPELYLYPLYMLAISTVIQFDPRFCFAFYICITPVCVAAVVEMLIKRRWQELCGDNLAQP